MPEFSSATGLALRLIIAALGILACGEGPTASLGMATCDLSFPQDGTTLDFGIAAVGSCVDEAIVLENEGSSRCDDYNLLMLITSEARRFTFGREPRPPDSGDSVGFFIDVDPDSATEEFWFIEPAGSLRVGMRFCPDEPSTSYRTRLNIYRGPEPVVSDRPSAAIDLSGRSQ
jgi:hypothetical protein